MWESLTPGWDLRNWTRKIIRDTIASQTEDGLVPDICPEYVQFAGGFRDDPSWGGASVFLPVRLYDTYGDVETLRLAYPTMNKYMDYLAGCAADGLLDKGLGDWGSPNVKTSETPLSFVVSTVYFELAKNMSRAAEILGVPEDQSQYTALAETVRKAVLDRFCNLDTAEIASGSQASYAMALYYHLIPEEDRPAILQRLVERMRADGDHFSCGEIALKPVIWSLAEGGETEELRKALFGDTWPSYLYFVTHGATSLPEYWDMQGSQLHCMMGHIVGWFYAFLAGIRATSPAYRTFRVEPVFIPEVEELSAAVRMPYGEISIRYNKEKLTLTVPFGTEAELILHGREEKLTAGCYVFDM